MDLSLIIPVYNCEDYISETLDSLIEQCKYNIEIILINDGSTDRSLEIINNKLNNSTLKIRVICQKNKGVSAARNLGIAFASGDYIAFLDADDTLEPYFFEKIIYQIKLHDPDIIQFNFNFWNKIKKKSGIELQNGMYEKSYELLLNIFNFNSWYPWSRVYKRELFSDISFPLGFTFEDPSVIPFLFIKSKNILIVDDYLYNYRENLSSITRSIDKEKIYKNMLSIDNLLKIYCAQENSLFKICFIHFFRIYLDYCFMFGGVNELKIGWYKYKDYYLSICENDRKIIKSKAGKLFTSLSYFSYFSYFIVKSCSTFLLFLKKL